MILWKKWLQGKAFPLWSNAGFNRKRRLYHERLTFNARPIDVVDLRLMVQARQIATFCRAQIDGLLKQSDDPILCLAEVQKHYWHRDGEPGWIFSLTPEGLPAKITRDLYAHAFILFAHAWAYRLTGELAILRVARETVYEVENIFSLPHGGFFDVIPSQDSIRRQNPHMHLLEAYLALFEATQDEFYLERARKLVELAKKTFICAQSGMILEFLTEEWKPCKKFGNNSVEPGHIFEWSWLFSEMLRLDSNFSKTINIEKNVEHLFQVGIKYGVEDAAVFDAMNEKGHITCKNTRIWPQTELMRVLACRAKNEQSSSVTEQGLLRTLTEKFFDLYAPDALQGGWFDRRDSKGVVMVDHMPASSFYHIYGAARELCGPLTF
ncbi:AGE family epimerase/isomerase [Acetobacter orientalis]|uniref:Mannose-6-phosphate isomerase n=1 Tax=Acetobacter orientalis TaxID=146474 RepID=A0A251ZY29_9PROT|nr:AGE family epimerase/isomerase [Acetobacter orientalis]OUI79567.1 hypothetical protein HK12_13720 [Acetobacter orientalis]